MSFDIRTRIDPIGVVGAISGFFASLVSGPIIRILVPIAAAALVALIFNQVDFRIKERYGALGIASITGLAFAVEPLQDAARGFTSGIFSLFASFLLTMLGYQLTHSVRDYLGPRGSEDDDFEESEG